VQAARRNEPANAGGITATPRALSDPYAKAFRWASNRIGDEGIVAFVPIADYQVF
jgi:predicted helicase